ncbi:hypothetical protein ACVWYH_002035 [Bradyrhizobium sp. GM24.11]
MIPGTSGLPARDVKPLLPVVEQFRNIILNSLKNMEFESVE